jgi:uncharacterized protein (DUF2147 family)
MLRPALALPLALAGALALGPVAAPAATDPVFGRWLVEDGEAVIEISPCGGQACGRVVWLKAPWDAGGNPKRDIENPQAAQRSRPLCGLRLIEGLSPAGDGSWEGGTIYSARDGRTYGFQIAPEGRDRLHVRGYLGISLLGGSQTWVREDGMRGGCTMITRPGADR